MAKLEAIEETPEYWQYVGAHLPGFAPAPANQLLNTAYGNWPHHNDGRHPGRGVVGDVAWQQH